jgi:hypothetical protein
VQPACRGADEGLCCCIDADVIARGIAGRRQVETLSATRQLAATDDAGVSKDPAPYSAPLGIE